jgi:hypothetical protein
MMLAPGFKAQCEVLTRTCEGEEMDGIGTVDSDSTSDGRPAFECVHAFIVVGAMFCVRGCEEVGGLRWGVVGLYRAAPVKGNTTASGYDFARGAEIS